MSPNYEFLIKSFTKDMDTRYENIYEYLVDF